MKYRLEDFMDPVPAELPPDVALCDRVTALEAEVAYLKADMRDYKSSLTDLDGWFQRHLSNLASYAAKEFVQKREVEVLLTALGKVELEKLEKQIQQHVQEVFEREANGLAKAIFGAVCSKIQPYALKK